MTASSQRSDAEADRAHQRERVRVRDDARPQPVVNAISPSFT